MESGFITLLAYLRPNPSAKPRVSDLILKSAICARFGELPPNGQS
jgi:hypothetical protein